MRRQRAAAEVTFLPAGARVQARAGDTLLDAALDNGIDLPHECGGNCSCTTCHVRVWAGADHLSEMEAPERERLATAPDADEGSRLACQVLLLGGAVTAEIVGRTGEWRLDE